MEFFKQSVADTFLLLFDGVSEAVIVVNTGHHIVAANSAAFEMFGYSEKELIGSHLDKLIPSNYHKAHKTHVKGFMKAREKRSMGKGRDIYGLRKDGEIIALEAGLNPFDLDGHKYVMAIITDITVRKQQEEAIRSFNEELEKKIQKRTRQLTEALKKEKELNELKTKFLSLVSHEFKTPLSGILTSASLAGKYTLTEQQDKREKHLETIKSKVKYLNNIIDDFLSIERLATGKVTYKLTAFPLSKVLNEVIYNANTQLKEGQHIKYPSDVETIVVEFDEKVLELIVANLLHNAIKYSGAGTIIDIAVSQSDNMLCICVTDQGIGIPEEEQKYIFSRYFRAGNVLTIAGTGIGLNIVKGHLENLGGTITFVSKEGEGTSFTVNIPTPNKR